MTVPYKAGTHYFDVYHGVEIKPLMEAGNAVLSFSTEAHGFGAVLATTSDPDANTQQLLEQMKTMTAKPCQASLTNGK